MGWPCGCKSGSNFASRSSRISSSSLGLYFSLAFNFSSNACARRHVGKLWMSVPAKLFNSMSMDSCASFWRRRRCCRSQSRSAAGGKSCHVCVVPSVLCQPSQSIYRFSVECIIDHETQVPHIYTSYCQ